MNTKRILVYAAIVLAPLAAGWLGSLFTMDAIPGWYAGLAKPALNPPSWVFGPVWTALYLMMGIAACIVWSKRSGGQNSKRTRGSGDNVRRGMRLFWVQLAANAVWSPLFFGLQNPGAALVDIVALWILILLTMIAFFNVSRTAGWLLVPYLAWVTFATYLNSTIWLLNGF